MSPRSLSGAVALAGALAWFGALAGCKADRAAESPASPPASSASSPASAPVIITATDYKLDLPSTIPAGAVTLRLLNHGKELHQAQVIRLEDGKTLADFERAMKSNGPVPPWVKFVGGPNGTAPGQEATSTTPLVPGHYAALCLIPGPDGVPHLMKGMIQPFEVTGGAGAAAPSQTAGDTVRMADYSFEQSRPLTPGRHTILVQNAGPQPHELVLLRLAPGKSAKDFATWATSGGMHGPPPAMPLGGVGVIEKGGAGVFTADLATGDYGFICFVPDIKDGKLHLAHGMIKQIRVG